MLNYSLHTLENGLKIILHPDDTVQTATVNILYNVGARNENPELTGMAHLFEHLMFSGSKHAEDYDEILQNVGGENNAYTTNDFTNYYITLPYQNIETAIWLEADRMHLLNLNSHSLDVQKKVVIEEFKEHYINKPYGDAWKHLRELVYTQHPYQWMTIGKTPEHIEKVTLQIALDFYKKFYSPNNAIICIAGKIEEEKVLQYCNKYFGSIPASHLSIEDIPDEPVQTETRIKTVQSNVPLDAVWIAFPMSPRLEKKYYMTDVITDILGSGKTAVLYQEFVKNRKSFMEISCYHTGSINNGIVVIEGKVSNEVDYDKAVGELINFIEEFRNQKIENIVLEKIKNRIESLYVFEDIHLLNRANNLAYYTWLGDTEIIHQELNNYLSIDINELNSFLPDLFHPNKMNILHYKKAV